MPTYDYECSNCQYRFDTFQNMSDDPLSVCPECNQEALRRLIGGGAGIIFKGSGFYVTDSKGKKAGKSSAAASNESDGSGSSGDNAKSGDGSAVSSEGGGKSESGGSESTGDSGGSKSGNEKSSSKVSSKST